MFRYKMVKKINPRELEKDFNEIKKEIDLCIHNRDNFSIPDDDLFDALDLEYDLITQVYEAIEDLCNLYHIKHNYCSTKTYQYLGKPDSYKALDHYLSALKSLLLRHQTRKYREYPLKKMINTYKSTWIKICQFRVDVEIKNIKQFEDFINFCLSYPDDIDPDLQFLIKYIIDYFQEKINNLLLSRPIYTEKDCSIFEQGLGVYKRLIEMAKKLPIFKHYIFTKNYEALFRLTKYILHFHLDYGKDDLKVKELTADLMKYSNMSLKHGMRYLNKLSSEEKERSKSVTVYKELDFLHAFFYYHLYNEKDILKALETMNNIKEFLVKNAFSKDIQFSKPLLEYFADELILIENYCYLVNLKEKIQKDIDKISQNWIKTLFDNINEILESNISQFRYEYKLKGGYKLGILSSTFAGYFSEFILHYLLLKFKEYNGNVNEIPSNFKNILSDVISASSEDDIVLNDTESVENTDIDIHIKGKSAILLKNENITHRARSKIRRELKICLENRILRIYYGINFMKNLENIESLRKFRNDLMNEFSELDLSFFDIKELVNTLINYFRKHKIKIFGFPAKELYKTLDY